MSVKINGILVKVFVSFSYLVVKKAHTQYITIHFLQWEKQQASGTLEFHMSFWYLASPHGSCRMCVCKTGRIRKNCVLFGAINRLAQGGVQNLDWHTWPLQRITYDIRTGVTLCSLQAKGGRADNWITNVWTQWKERIRATYSQLLCRMCDRLELQKMRIVQLQKQRQLLHWY